MLEAFLGRGADGEEGIVCGEGGEAVVLGGVGKGEGAACEYAEGFGCWEWKGERDG